MIMRFIRIYEIQSWKYSIFFCTIQSFDTFQKQEIFTGAGAIQGQLADLDLEIIVYYSLVDWKKLGEEGPMANEWKDRKVRRLSYFLFK